MQKHERITTLFLDIGGVLLSDGWGHDFRHRAAEKFQINLAEMEERHGPMFAPYEEGILGLDEYLGRVIFFKERDFTPKEFFAFMCSMTTSHQEMIDLFKKLKQRYGLKIVVVSNEAEQLNAFRIRQFRLHDFVDFFVSSCYVRVRKPDRAIFKMALNMAQVAADQVVYIDDVRLFTEVASDMGIQSIHHSNYDQTLSALAAMGLKLEENKITHE